VADNAQSPPALRWPASTSHSSYTLLKRQSAPLAVSLVSGIAPDPSAFTTQMLKVLFVLAASLPFKARAESKAILLPSDDHAGEELVALVAVILVRGIAPDPSAFITQTLRVPFVLTASLPSKARDELNAILPPSGDHAPTELSAPLAVILVNGMAPDPSAFITQMLEVPFVLVALLPSKARAERNAILLLSGDHTPTKLSAPLAVSLVRGVTPVPSAFITQMFRVPFVLVASLPSNARAESKAILLPSGDHAGN